MSRPFVYRRPGRGGQWFLLHQRCRRAFDDEFWLTTYDGPFKTAAEANDAALKHLEMEHPDD